MSNFDVLDFPTDHDRVLQFQYHHYPIRHYQRVCEILYRYVTDMTNPASLPEVDYAEELQDDLTIEEAFDALRRYKEQRHLAR